MFFTLGYEKHFHNVHTLSNFEMLMVSLHIIQTKSWYKQTKMFTLPLCTSTKATFISFGFMLFESTEHISWQYLAAPEACVFHDVK